MLVAVSAAAGPLAATTPLGIFGDDDQRIIDAADRRWNAVGRLNRESGGFCTAVLIAPREALTAAHCLWDQSQRRWVQPSTVHFVPGYRRGTYLGHSRGKAFRLADGIAKSNAARLPWRGEANELFPIMPKATAARLRAAGAVFHTWQTLPDGDEMVRFVTSFATTPDEVDRFLALL